MESPLLARHESYNPRSPANLLFMAGLCLYTLTIVTGRLPLGDVGIAIAVLGLALQPSRFRMPAPLWLFIAYVAWGFAGSFASSYPGIVLDRIVGQLKLLCVMLIVVNALRTEGQIRFFLLFYLACFMVYPVRTTLHNYMIGNIVEGRAVGNGIYYNSNDLATFSLFALGVALGFALADTRQRIIRLLALASAFLLLVVILLTQSRGAVIGLVVSMVPALVVIGWRRPGRFIASGVLLALVIGFAIPSNVWDRLSGIGKLTSTETIAEADREGSAEQRFNILQVAIRITRDHPFLGIGLGAYPEANDQYAPELGKRDTHNTYMNLAAELGLPGLLLWGTLVMNVLRGAYKARKDLPPGPMAILQSWIERALWAYLIAALFGTYSKINVLYVMLALLWCSAAILKSTPVSTKYIDSAPAVPKI